MKFKTNARCHGCVAAIKTALASLVPAEYITFDLNTSDKVMTIDAQVDAEAVEDAVRKAGFNIERL